MSNLFAELHINPEEFLPVSTVNPLERAKVQVVRVSVTPKQTGAKKGGARLNVTFSPSVTEAMGLEAQAKAAVMMGRRPGQILVCSAQAGQDAFPGTALPTFTVSNSGGKLAGALRKIAFAPPFWCVPERIEAIEAASFKVTAGALLINLPDSFIRPEYLLEMPVSTTGGTVAAALPPRASEPAEPPAGATCSAPEDAAGDPAPKPLDTNNFHDQPDNGNPAPIGAPTPADIAVDTGQAVPELIETSSLPTEAVPVEQPAGEQPPSEEELFRQDADALYGVLLGCARQGLECPPNTTLCQSLVDGEVLKSVYVTALFKNLQEEGRISFSFIDSRGKHFDSYAKGRLRVVELLTGPEKGLVTRNSFAVAAPAASSQTPSAPIGLPKAAVKVRGLSEAERELQEAVEATKNAANEDFEFLKSKGVPIVRNEGNAGLPFKINGAAVSEAEVSRRARELRLLTRKSA